MLVMLVQDNVSVFVDQLLHGVLHKLVERIELLTNESFFIKK